MTADMMKRLKSGIELEGIPELPQDFVETISNNVFGPMANLLDTPRNAYMNTVRFILLTVELLTHALAAEKAGKSGVGISLVERQA